MQAMLCAHASFIWGKADLLIWMGNYITLEQKCIIMGLGAVNDMEKGCRWVFSSNFGAEAKQSLVGLSCIKGELCG